MIHLYLCYTTSDSSQDKNRVFFILDSDGVEYECLQSGGFFN